MDQIERERMMVENEKLLVCTPEPMILISMGFDRAKICIQKLAPEVNEYVDCEKKVDETSLEFQRRLFVEFSSRGQIVCFS